MNRNLLNYLLIMLLSAPLLAEAQLPQLNFPPFATGLFEPLGIVSAGDSRLFVVEQHGTIVILDSTGIKQATPFLDITPLVNSVGSERGLLGLAFHPDYAQNGYFYVNYTRNPDGNTRIARYTRSAANPNQADPGSAVTLLEIPQPYANHNGGNILFGPDGYLYIGMGDGGSGGDPQNNAQNGQQLLGKMLRIDVDNGSPYGIPADNPFVNDPAVKDETWAIGLRNPWRWSFDRITGDLWIADVGQNLWEEINFQPAGTAGLNYGWRCYEAIYPFNTNGCGPQSTYTDPIFQYDHNNANGCSVTGGFVYRGAKFNKLYGTYLHTDYCSGQFWGTTRTANGGFSASVLGTFVPFEYVAMGEDRYGELYLVGKGSGTIYRVEETSSCAPTAAIIGADTQLVSPAAPLLLKAVSGPGISYQWEQNGIPIPGATSPLLSVVTPGIYTVTATKSACSLQSEPVVVQAATGLQPMGAQLHFSLYPNPNNGSFIVEVPETWRSQGSLAIIDMLGKLVYQQELNPNAPELISIPGLKPGIYQLQLLHCYQHGHQIFRVE